VIMQRSLRRPRPSIDKGSTGSSPHLSLTKLKPQPNDIQFGPVSWMCPITEIVFIALKLTSKRRGTSIVMPSSKTGQDAARRRFFLAMSGFVMALALLPFSYKVERRLETAVHIKDGESEKVDLELAQRFQSPYAHRLVLVISGIPDPDSAKGADALGFLTSSLRSLPGVSGEVSSLDWPDALFTGNNGGALIIVGLDPHDETVEALVPKLRAKADWMEGQLRSQYPDINLEITGETPLTVDIRKVSA